MESKNLIFIKKPILMLASCLVLGFFVLFFSCFESKAEVVVPISGCNDRSCLELPTSSVISNDGSFFLIIDSKTSSSLKKFSHTANGFTANESINLNINNTNLAQLQISLSSDNKKVLIHKPPKGTEKSIVLIVDLNDNSVKRLNTTNLNNQEINAVAFSDSSGNKLILGSNTSNNKSSNLIIINSQDGDIEKSIPLPDTVGSLSVSPNFKSAVITYATFFSQSVSIYDLETGNIIRLDTPQELFF